MTSRIVTEIDVQNTRLFPKNRGADAFQLTGIAARCDWAIMTDKTAGIFSASLRGDFSRQPRTVFLSLRAIFDSIPYFFEEILPQINTPFILVTGSEDATVPNQIDARWREFNSREKGIIDKILQDERVIHWFAENRDEPRKKMSSLPVGYVLNSNCTSRTHISPIESPVMERPLKVLCSHRVREGAQWQTRKHVTRLCQEHFMAFSSIFTEELSLADFQRSVRAHPFVLCVNGGGLEPSPKAWFCILNGSIPVIKSSVLDDAYRQLPVAFVDDWSTDCISIEKLETWREALAPFYDCEDLRAQTVQKLSIDYWWQWIISAYHSTSEMS